MKWVTILVGHTVQPKKITCFSGVEISAMSWIIRSITISFILKRENTDPYLSSSLE